MTGHGSFAVGIVLVRFYVGTVLRLSAIFASHCAMSALKGSHITHAVSCSRLQSRLEFHSVRGLQVQIVSVQRRNGRSSFFPGADANSGAIA